MLYKVQAQAAMSWVLAWTVLLFAVSGSAAERYIISPQKSQLQFKAYSLLAKPTGTFHSFSGDIIADAQQLRASSVHFVIDARSIDTANAKRDRHLRSEDFLFVEKYPTISFRSTAITQEGAGYLVQGNLELRGVTKPLTIPLTVEQHQDDIVVHGRITLNRRVFGMQYNFVLNPVQDKVDVLFTIVGVKREPVSAAR
jgi:polyisoprenoid-binding protein YceI